MKKVQELKEIEFRETSQTTASVETSGYYLNVSPTLSTTISDQLTTQLPIHRGAGRPDAGAPISVNSSNGSRRPLYSGRYDAPVYGHDMDGEPL